MEDVRAANREIARAYDERPYEPAIGFALDPDLLFERAAAWGCAPRELPAADVLDLGCGTGGQLWRAGHVATGRLVGVDLSPVACARARERVAVFGDRAEIRCSDFLDVGPDLGTFDLIYVIGTYYATPPAVRAHLAALIGACLAPDGLLVASYYTGAAGRARAAEVAAVRSGQRAAAASADDVIAYEVLSPWFDAFDDDELAAALGLRFLTHLDPGGYVYGLFRTTQT